MAKSVGSGEAVQSQGVTGEGVTEHWGGVLARMACARARSDAVVGPDAAKVGSGPVWMLLIWGMLPRMERELGLRTEARRGAIIAEYGRF